MDESNRFSAFIEALRARTAASVATSQDLYTYYQYNSAGQLILKASPSAVTGYSEEDPDLVGWSGDTATFLNSGSGLITTYEYGASTTAESDTAGDVTGYLKDVSIQEGTGGTPVPQDDYTYFSNTVSGVSIYPVASTTQYRNSDGTGAETTSYAYTFFSDTNAIQSITTTLPTVTTGENGPDSATSTTTFLDQYGRPIWEKNQDGYINYTQYDDATGAVTEQIQDVKTCITGDYSDLPEGWSTIDGAGLNLVTTYVVDSLGRTTEVTSPSGMVTYTVYLDGSNEVRTYSGWNSTTHAPTGPTTVTIDDWADGYVETLTMTVAPYLSSGAPDGLEPISDVQSLTRNYETPGGVVTETDDYFNLGGLTYTSGTLGTSGVNYYATLYGYDEDGNLNRTLSPQGTIYRTVFNDQHQPISKWVGTNDTVSLGAWSPSNMGSGNMVETEAYVYNNDGDLTQTTQSPGGMATNSVTDYWYDWRDQEVAEQQGVEMSELDSVNRPLTVYTYNNLNEVIETQVYNGSGVTLTIVSGELSLPYGTSSDLQAQTVTSYDELGQVYQTQVYSVNPTNGDVSEYALTTNYYRDGDGNVIATSAPGGLWTKDTFNGAGWQVMQYETDGGGGASYAAADSITSDVVLTQTKTDYNKDGDETETITRDRFNTDSDDSTGALGTPTSGVEARVYYSGNYYDLGDRLIASVNVGTNGGSAWCMPDDVPTPSDTVLVTSYAYAADAVQTVTLTGSPTGGTFTLTFGGDTTSNIAYNASASTIQTDLVALGSIGSGNVVVTQAVDGGWEVRFMGSLAGTYQTQMTASGSDLTGGSSPSVSVNTLSLGGDAGHVVDTTDPDGIDTRTYSDPLGRAVQTIQDFTNGAVTDSSNKTTDYTYNSVGQTSLTAELTDGVGETTTWIYGVTTGTGSTIDSDDVMSVTEQPSPSTGLPDSSIETTVTVNGQGQTLTSTDPNGTTHTYTYDVLGQETKDAVTTLGSGVDGSVLRIETSYTTLGDQYIITSYNAASGGSVVNQVENVYNGLDQLIQQFQAVSGSVNVDTTPSVQYNYVDLLYGANNSRLVTTTYPDGYQVNDTYATGTDNNISRLTSLTDDHGTLESYSYLGLSTVVEMDHPETGVNMTYISQDETTGDAGDQYIGLDRFGRVVGQNWYDPDTSSSVVDLQYGYDADGNVLYRSDLVNTAMSELYGYDSLGQITSFERGTLNEGDTAITGTPSVDETWGYDPVGNRLTNTVGETTTTETANLQNEITSVSGATTPSYDANGNMLVDQTGLIYSYNAWNEVVKVENSGETTLETYSYNGLGQRVTNTVGATTTSFYYSTTGQILEEQVSGKFVTRYVWSPVYVNEMIFRDTDTSGTGLTATGTSYTRLWVVQDANHNVVALLNSSGAVIELYAYDPFGAVTVMNADYTVLDASSYNWVYLFQGGRLDTITGDTHFGARDENSGLGVWTSMDPKGFAAGDEDLYGFEGNSSTTLVDPSGMAGMSIGSLPDLQDQSGAVASGITTAALAANVVSLLGSKQKTVLGLETALDAASTAYQANLVAYRAAQTTLGFADKPFFSGLPDLVAFVQSQSALTASANMIASLYEQYYTAYWDLLATRIVANSFRPDLFPEGLAPWDYKELLDPMGKPVNWFYHTSDWD